MSSSRTASRGRRFAAALLLSLLPLSGFATTGFPGAEVMQPPDDDTILLTLDRAAASSRIARLRQRLANGRDDLDAATELAREYLRLASREGDPRYAGWARAALEPWWNQATPPVQVLILRARYRQHQHDFAGAIADLDAALKRSPRAPSAWLLKSSVHRVLGDLDAAARSCRQLAAVTSDTLTAMLCRMDIEMLTRGPQRAATQLQAVLVAADRLPDWQSEWARLLAAEAYRMLDRPERGLAVLGENADTSYELGLRADLLIEQGRPRKAADLVAGRLKVNALLLRYAIALKAAGDPAWREARQRLAERFAATDRRGAGVPHWRERARAALELDEQPVRALDLAQRNWQNQRDLADARLLALSAAAAGEPDAAAPLREWRRQYGIRDRILTRALDGRLAEEARR